MFGSSSETQWEFLKLQLKHKNPADNCPEAALPLRPQTASPSPRSDQAASGRQSLAPLLDDRLGAGGSLHPTALFFSLSPPTQSSETKRAQSLTAFQTGDECAPRTDHEPPPDTSDRSDRAPRTVPNEAPGQELQLPTGPEVLPVKADSGRTRRAGPHTDHAGLGLEPRDSPAGRHALAARVTVT